MILQSSGHLNTSHWTSLTRHFSHIFTYIHWRDPHNKKSCTILTIFFFFCSFSTTSWPFCVSSGRLPLHPSLGHLNYPLSSGRPTSIYIYRSCRPPAPITLPYLVPFIYTLRMYKPYLSRSYPNWIKKTLIFPQCMCSKEMIFNLFFLQILVLNFDSEFLFSNMEIELSLLQT